MTNNTFWKLISDSEVVIPTIQRDYAYGRKEAKNILTKLLTDIKNELEKGNRGHLHLAFVYGKLEGKKDDEIFKRNAENIKELLKSVKEYAENMDILVDFDTNKGVRHSSECVTFIPIDGQQRLTTLFLLHVYFALHLNQKESSMYLNKLIKFKYASRITSKEFCHMLCSMRVVAYNRATLVIDKEFIINNENFFKQWLNDPTVRNMLDVIDMINSMFKESKEHFFDYLELLTNTDIICFDFFDLNRFQLTDELYVKMNSRGKPLSQFEKFKAWLYVEKKISDTDVIKKRFDIQWNDIFWNAKKNVKADIDIAYLQWFKNLFLPFYIGSELFTNSIEEKKDEELLDYTTDSKSVIGIIRNPSGKFLDLLESNIELKKLFIQKVNLNILDSIAFNHQHDNSAEMSEEYVENLKAISINKEFYAGTVEDLLFTEQPNLNWWHVTFQFAIVGYISKFKYDNKKLKRYLRVISNLIFNTAINGPLNYKSAIESIEGIIENLVSYDGCIITLLKDQNARFKFFSEEQQQEEVLKASKYLQGNNFNAWEAIIIEAESHIYFYGQIGFLFELLNDKNDLGEFTILLLKAKNIFSEEILNTKNNFLFRSLLATIGAKLFIKDDAIWRYPINDYTTLRTRNENWRRCLLKTELIISLKDFIEGNSFKDIDETVLILSDKISAFNDNNSYLDLIIKNERLLNDSLRQCIWFYNPTRNQVYTMNTATIRGYYRELYTINWYIQNFHLFESDYPEFKINVRGLMHDIEDQDCGLSIEYLKNGVSHHYAVYRDYDNDKFKILLVSSNYEEIGLRSNNTIEELLEFIKTI